MRIAKIINTFLVIAILFIVTACPKPPPDDDKAYISSLEDGWDYFVKYEYDNAYNSFDEALDIKSSGVEANVGLGWSSIMLDDDQSIEAVGYLEKGIDDEEWKKISYAGLAIYYFYFENYAKSSKSIDSVLTAPDSLFEFSKNPEIDHKDLRLLKAKIQYIDAEYTSCFR
ncbi:MAG: hypothetical protein KAI81_05105, partial [Candidatus Marinimicrobia bacterium]|nr:hypothetical protein [Candidatus Neomarinimicrobiota bacterium]